MKRVLLTIVLLILSATVPLSSSKNRLRVGSKKFTESVILGEMVTLLAEDSAVAATHYRELGGTKLVFQALRSGDIDVYPEYTGTIAEEILAGQKVESIEALRSALGSMQVRMSEPLGFNNTYAIGMLRSRAAELGIESISDLRRHPDLVCGFSNEFVDRKDGWRNLQIDYGLPQENISGLDHDLAYRQLRLGAIDLIDIYATDAKIGLYDILPLRDDRSFFPRYDAVLLYRADLPEREGTAWDSIARLSGEISESEMIAANARVEVDRDSESRVAADHLKNKLSVEVEVVEPSRIARVASRTAEHLDLVRKSLIPAILLAIPLGILAVKLPRIGQIVLAIVGIIQTIPSLALLVMLMPLVAALGLASIGLGSTTAIAALTLYSLLPIVRNTHEGFRSIAPEHRDAAAALGLAPVYRLTRIELPLASRGILAGIKTAAVLNIGFATLGALIGAGGYGQPIITGIRLNDTALILEGAVPAALLAVVAQLGFEIAERWLVPRGLRVGDSR